MATDRLGLRGLSLDGLAALRLSAQVMAHRAHLANRQRVALYFESLESAAMAEQAARQQDNRAPFEPGPPALLALEADPADRALVAEYLDLLAANQRLSVELRAYLRVLRLEHAGRATRADA